MAIIGASGSALQVRQALQQALQPKYEDLAMLNQQIKQYQSIDWNALVTNNPQEAMKYQMLYQHPTMLTVHSHRQILL